MPIVILSEHRNTYLDALEGTDAGKYQSFIDFILARSLDTIVLVNESLLCALTPSAEQSAAGINALYVTRGGYSHEQVDQAGISLVHTLHKALGEAFSKISAAKIAHGLSFSGGQGYALPPEYRFPLTGPQILHCTLTSQPPAQAQVQRQYGLLLPKDAAGEDDVQIVTVRSSGSGDTFIARVDEIIPGASGVLSLRLTMFAERIASQMLAELRTLAETNSGIRR